MHKALANEHFYTTQSLPTTFRYPGCLQFATMASAQIERISGIRTLSSCVLLALIVLCFAILHEMGAYWEGGKAGFSYWSWMLSFSLFWCVLEISIPSYSP